MKKKKADRLFIKLEKKLKKNVAEKKKKAEQEKKRDKELIEFMVAFQKMIVELVRPEMKVVLKPFSKKGFETKINKLEVSKKITMDSSISESYDIWHPANPDTVLRIWIEMFDYEPHFAFGYNFNNDKNDLLISKQKAYTLKEFDAGIIQKVFKKGIKKFLKNS